MVDRPGKATVKAARDALRFWNADRLHPVGVKRRVQLVRPGLTRIHTLSRKVIGFQTTAFHLLKGGCQESVLLLKNETVRDQMISGNHACLVRHTIGRVLYPAASRAIRL